MGGAGAGPAGPSPPEGWGYPLRPHVTDIRNARGDEQHCLLPFRGRTPDFAPQPQLRQADHQEEAQGHHRGAQQE